MIVARKGNGNGKHFDTMQFKSLLVAKVPRADCPTQRQQIQEALELNEDFAKLEIIKEKMFTFFEAKTEEDGKLVFNEVGQWVREAQFEPLISWWKKLMFGWDTLRNYFADRVTTALSEGINNVVKALKRRAFGFRNMEYFKLKIMSVCGYLNSKYLSGIGGIWIRGVSTGLE